MRIKLVTERVRRAEAQLLEPRLEFTEGFGVETQHQTLRECFGCLDRFWRKQNGLMAIGELLEALDRHSFTIGLISIKNMAVKSEIQRQYANFSPQRNLLTGLSGKLIQPVLRLRAWLKPIGHSL